MMDEDYDETVLRLMNGDKVADDMQGDTANKSVPLMSAHCNSTGSISI